MPVKATTTKTRARPAADHVTYQDMITDAIVNLKERNGASRVALKKYIKANHKHIVDGKMFDSLFNRALKSGVEKGIFAQPKGASGGTKLAKKEAKPSSSKPSSKSVDVKAIEKKTIEKKLTTKKAASSKKVNPRKVEATKISVTTAKPKTVPRAKKSTKAEVTSDIPAVLRKTKSGRVTKTITTGKSVTSKKKPTGKKVSAK